ncbi:ribosome silencing factor [Chlamydiifrater phoenicopteri]|uniref:ribosome silencing factor n=1 Tax=Chlamydiifrater phoenicopteri TaxID=2681469 RepID=UPI001BCD2209|nr:ribosome silencing factor [Chlamydiifrater phoenicopteri]
MEVFCFNALKIVAKAIDDKKGCNTVVLDVRAISELTDFFVFAEGNVGVHVRAIAEYVVSQLKEECKLSPLYVEGLSHSEWVVLDYGFIVVHLFTSSVRDHYRLEEVWKDGAVITSKLLAS